MTTQSQEEFIVNNMNIVKNIASKYYTDKIGLDYEDLVSYGVMGLIDARKKFDESRGVKFYNLCFNQSIFIYNRRNKKILTGIKNLYEQNKGIQ